MASVSQKTWGEIRSMFPPEHHQTVADILDKECSHSLPFLERADSQRLERYHHAALVLSQGSLDGLRQAIDLAKADWRDLLMAASEMESIAGRKRRRFRLPWH